MCVKYWVCVFGGSFGFAVEINKEQGIIYMYVKCWGYVFGGLFGWAVDVRKEE